jgi:hypothetical protein
MTCCAAMSRRKLKNGGATLFTLSRQAPRAHSTKVGQRHGQTYHMDGDSRESAQDRSAREYGSEFRKFLPRLSQLRPPMRSRHCAWEVARAAKAPRQLARRQETADARCGQFAAQCPSGSRERAPRKAGAHALAATDAESTAGPRCNGI